MNEQNTRVVLLGRVSTSEGQDVETQLNALRSVADRRGWEVADTLALELSAWDADEAQEVWDTIQASLNRTGADVLGVWALDRLARGGIKDLLEKLEHLEHLGVRLYSMQEPFLSTTQEGTRDLLVSLLAWVSEQESTRRSERLKAKAQARRKKAQQGRRTATWGRGNMATREDAQRILALQENGHTYQEIEEETGFSIATVSRIVNGDHPCLHDEPETPA